MAVACAIDSARGHPHDSAFLLQAAAEQAASLGVSARMRGGAETVCGTAAAQADAATVLAGDHGASIMGMALTDKAPSARCQRQWRGPDTRRRGRVNNRRQQKPHIPAHTQQQAQLSSQTNTRTQVQNTRPATVSSSRQQQQHPSCRRPAGSARASIPQCRCSRTQQQATCRRRPGPFGGCSEW